MSVQLVSHYFQRELEKLGYDDVKAYWSLNCCQGDGMAFYGHADQEQLADRLMSGTAKAAVKRALDKGCSLSIGEVPGLSNHYSHYNTMSVDDLGYSSDDLTEFEETSWEAFVEAVEEDVKEVSKRLESDGYDLLDAGVRESEVIRVFNTARFSLRVTHEPEEDFDIADWDEEFKDDFFLALINGEIEYYSLKVEVVAIDTGIELGTSYLGQCTRHKGRPSKTENGYLRQMVHEAVEEARRALASMCLRAA